MHVISRSSPLKVYYNNLLSVPPLAILSLSLGEPWRLFDYHHMFDAEFQASLNTNLHWHRYTRYCTKHPS